MVYFEGHDPPWTSPAVGEVKRRKIDVRNSSDMDVVLCCWNLMRTEADKFRRLWNWSTFISNYLTHSDPDVKWYVWMVYT